jgi:hypothetical protein
MSLRLCAWLSLGLVIGCGGGGNDGPDFSANFTGQWNGTVIVTVNGQSQSTPGLSVHITPTGKNALVIGDICSDLSGPPASVTGASTLTIGAKACPPAPVTGCSAVTLSVTKGTGVVSGNTLSFVFDGTVAGCSQSVGFSASFTGTRV